ncbi:hypothetical protein HC928_02800, partial [bacterium]|nr:hypothetical protein [bacterium]
MSSILAISNNTACRRFLKHTYFRETLMEPIITTLLTLGAAGAGAAGVRYLWRLASGAATEHQRLQAQ